MKLWKYQDASNEISLRNRYLLGKESVYINDTKQSSSWQGKIYDFSIGNDTYSVDTRVYWGLGLKFYKNNQLLVKKFLPWKLIYILIFVLIIINFSKIDDLGTAFGKKFYHLLN